MKWVGTLTNHWKLLILSSSELVILPLNEFGSLCNYIGTQKLKLFSIRIDVTLIVISLVILLSSNIITSQLNIHD